MFVGFTGLLDTMYKAKEIGKDLKNLSKPVFEKIEKFILQKIDSQVLAEHITKMKKGCFNKQTNLS